MRPIAALLLASLLASAASVHGDGPSPPAPRPPPPGTEAPEWVRVSTSQREEAIRLGVPVALDVPASGLRFVLIPGGTFVMGSPDLEPGHRPDEAPQVRVTISPFYLSIHEVTNRQFRHLVSEHRSGDYTPGQGSARGRPMTLDGDDQPVVRVSHRDATDYAARHTAMSDATLDGARYRLPFEAEWEYACRAGSTTRFPWGDAESAGPQHANINDPATNEAFGLDAARWPADDGFRATAPVGRLLPNAFGLHDMIGNVQEWCREFKADRWFASLASGPPAIRVDPRGPRGGDRRVARGGGFTATPDRARSATRDGFPAEIASGDVGFRLVRTLPTTYPVHTRRSTLDGVVVLTERVAPLLGLDDRPSQWESVELHGVRVTLEAGVIAFDGVASTGGSAAEPTVALASRALFERDTLQELRFQVRVPPRDPKGPPSPTRTTTDDRTFGIAVQSPTFSDPSPQRTPGRAPGIAVFYDGGRIAARVGGGVDPAWKDGEIHPVLGADGKERPWPKSEWVTIHLVLHEGGEGLVTAYVGEEKTPVLTERIGAWKRGRGPLELWIGGWTAAGRALDVRVRELEFLRAKR